MKQQFVSFNENKHRIGIRINKIFKEEKYTFKNAVNTSVVTSLVNLVWGKKKKNLNIVFAPKEGFTY